MGTHARKMLKGILALVGISALIGALNATSANTNQAAPPKATIEQRVAAVRERIARGQKNSASQSGEDSRLAQWPNWSNWGNWQNWNNWGNWFNG